MGSNTLASIASFLRAWLGRSRMEHDMDREMRFHLEARAADLESQGMSRADAERHARQEFGDVIRWKEAGREARGLAVVDDLGADLRYAVRTMRRSPGFTAAAVLSLAVGIGASTAIFGLLDLLLLKRLPVRNAHELVHVTTGITDLRAQFSTPLRLLMVAVGVLMLIACVNLAGLLLARNATRQHELGMRLALGARRSRIVRQLLTESTAIALLGATLGVALAIRGGNALVGLLPEYFGRLSIQLVADSHVLAFALVSTIVTTLLFGSMPAWQASQIAVLPALNRSGSRTATTRMRTGRVLVVAQFAL